MHSPIGSPGPTSTDSEPEETQDPSIHGERVVVPGSRIRARLGPTFGPIVQRSLRPAGLFVASRIMVAFVVGVVVDLGGAFAAKGFTGPWPSPPPGRLFFRALGSWDAGWYLGIAQHGYFGTLQPPQAPGAQIAFFPGWPYLLRFTADITGVNVLYEGAALVLVVGLLATVAVWWLARELCGEAVADRTAALWVFFPGAYVLSMVYSEALTIGASALCLLALAKRRWLVAGIAGAVATGVQPDALVLVAAAAVAAGLACRRDRDWSAIVAPVLSLGGVVTYFSYLWARTGDPMKWYHIEHSIWSSGSGFGTNTVVAVRDAFEHHGDLEALVPALGLVWVAIALILMIRWRPPAFIWVYGVGLILVALSSNPVGTRPRLLLAALPLLIAIARRVQGNVFTAVLGGSAVLLATFTMVTLSSILLVP